MPVTIMIRSAVPPGCLDDEPRTLSGAARGRWRGMEQTILLVDDDEAVRRILRKVLESSSYHVVESGHPYRACAMYDADREAIDLVVTDLKMPGMSGQQVAAHVWASRPELPVVFITG